MTPVAAKEAEAFERDLATLGLRVDAGEHRDRGGHDLRAWFITTAQESGAIAMFCASSPTRRKATWSVAKVVTPLGLEPKFSA
jgi:hypothetical protein